jgi:hypothetical protein
MTTTRENPMWSADKEHYVSTSHTFATMALILGSLGVVGSLVMLTLGLTDFNEGGVGALVAAIALGFQSVMLVVFGSMMHLLSKVVAALFEMSLNTLRESSDNPPEESGTDAARD